MYLCKERHIRSSIREGLEPMEDQTKEIEAKLAREQKVLDGAKKMLQVAADQTRQMCLIQIQDAQSRIAYLEGELKKLSASQDEVSTPGTSDSLPQGPQRSATVSFNIPPLPTTNRASVLGKGGVMGLFDKLTFKQAPQGPGTGNASKTGSTLSLSCPESEFPVPSLNFGNFKSS